MIRNRKLKLISILSSLLLIPIALYFKYFPSIINSNVSNISIVLLVFILISLLIYGSFILEKPKDIYFLIPQSLMLTFLARAVPNLRLSYPPLHDPYSHFVTTLNVIEYGTLKPILGWWYSGVDIQLHWPDMHLITTALVKTTNIDVMQFFRFQEPVLGMIFFLAVFLLTKTVTANNGVSLLAGLFASINDIIIFYQSEYHPQGISIIYLVLLLYTFLKSRQVSHVCYRYISLIFGTVFILSHYFTPIFLSLIFSSYIAVMLLIRIFSLFKSIFNKYGNMFENLTSDYVYFIIIVIASFSYHFFVYEGPLKMFLEMASMPVLDGQLVSIGQTNVPLFSSILSSFKWGLFILAIISIMFIFKTKNTDEFRLGIIMICIIFAGFVGNYIVASPLDRIIGFYVPSAAIFASLTLRRFNEKWFGGITNSTKLVMTVLLASVIISAGFFNSQTPAYFFQDSKVNTYYWYSNDLSSMDKYGVTGSWIQSYTSNESIYDVEFDTIILPYYYANRPFGSMNPNFHKKDSSGDFVVMNPMIKYSSDKLNNFDKHEYINSLNILYNNEILIVGMC